MACLLIIQNDIQAVWFGPKDLLDQNISFGKIPADMKCLGKRLPDIKESIEF